jgi:acyl-homoserine-lactone acylase
VDVVDEFLETIVERDGRFFYRYGDEERPVFTDTITVSYRTGDGGMAERTFVTFRTHHGPIVREQNGRWVAVALMERPIAALEQSFLRTKARTLAEYLEVMQLRANSSNNTVYADADGNIAYLHPQFVPRRAERFDYTKPVDGSDPATDWQGDHALSELPQVINPPTGWIQNTNNWPYSAAAGASPRREDFPRYMDTFGENWRGIHALRVLRGKRDFTLRSLIDAAFDRYLTAFAAMVPPLLADFDALPGSDPRRTELKPQVELLRGWNYHWGVASEATTLAVYWGEELRRIVDSKGVPANADYDYLATSATADQRLRALTAARERLKADFGTWRIAWGDVNRFQRLTGEIVQPFSDTGPSIPVGFTSAQWGSLASFGARSYPGTKKRYGTSGNSFVAAVEFGDSVRALAVTAGGESGDPSSPHFNDQAQRYATGDLRPVYFYPGQLTGHTERRYHPGQRKMGAGQR